MWGEKVTKLKRTSFEFKEIKETYKTHTQILFSERPSKDGGKSR